MRKLSKEGIPQLLAENAEAWLQEYLIEPQNPTRRYRYRAAPIKAAVVEETGWKCVYCESKVGHNTPGDIEHKIPTSKDPQLHFTWSNLTCACIECNRRKRDYYEEGNEFLDPYVDDVEDLVQHFGPVASWKPGSARAEISIKLLELSHPARLQLMLRKIEKISEFTELAERYFAAETQVLKSLLLKQLQQMRSRTSEYSAMLLAIGRQKGVPE